MRQIEPAESSVMETSVILGVRRRYKMRGFWKLCVIGIAMASVAACAGVERQIAAKTQPPSGTGYNAELSRGYFELTNLEYAEGDYRTSDHFALKAMAAGRGEAVAPDTIKSRTGVAKNPAFAAELGAARQRLMAAQGKGGAQIAPNDMARAQVMFDCWIQEQEENRQPRDIAACRNGFEEAMGKVELAMMPKAPAPVAMAPGEYLVFFDWNKATLTPEATAILDTAAANAKKMAGTKIVATGYTDLSGPADYNLGLSVRRADAVKASLVAQGIPAKNIATIGLGEADPLVPTEDGVREPQNRRVQILFEK
jgi:outer membrane protein OmpA-like peptidoglycan-associated protein